MKIKIINNNFNQDIYNKKAVHPLQSWQWGEARKKMGIEVLRIGEYQITFHKIPYINFKIGYLPRSTMPTNEVLEFLTEYGKRHRVIFIKIEPYVISNEVRNPLTGGRTSIDFSATPRNDKVILKKSPHPLFPSWTQILDLTKSEDKLLKNMHHKTRYNIRLAQKKGVIVKEISSGEGFEIFSKLYFDTCRRQKYFGHDYQYHKIIWDNLKKDIAHILIAYYKKLPLAAYELFYFNNVIYYPYGGTSLEYRNIMASNLLMWEAIKLGKTLGAKKFDMWGSLPPNYNESHPWAGFTKFKEGYGGQFTKLVGSYDLVFYPNIYPIYNFIYSLRNIYLHTRKILF